MKNKITRYISFFMASALILMAGCEKSDIEKANEAYDFSKIIPVIQGVTGKKPVVQTFPETYSLNYYRGGSSWSWSVSGATLLSTSADTRTIEVDFPTTGEAMITVTETTLGGVTSDPFVYSVTVNPPVVAGVTGPRTVLQTFTESYTVNYSRAGSTWSWNVTGATLVSTSADTKTIDVLFDTQGQATISVVETIHSGIQTVPYNVTVNVDEFCPLTRDDFLGTWDGVETGSTAGNFTVTIVAGTGDNDIILKATAGIPAVMSGVFNDWGETFVADYEPIGDISITINPNGSLSIPWMYWGRTDFDYDYWFWGSGTQTWSGCGAAPTMKFDLNLDWNGNSASPSSNRKNSVTLTKQVAK